MTRIFWIIVPSHGCDNFMYKYTCADPPFQILQGSTTDQGSWCDRIKVLWAALRLPWIRVLWAALYLLWNELLTTQDLNSTSEVWMLNCTTATLWRFVKRRFATRRFAQLRQLYKKQIWKWKKYLFEEKTNFCLERKLCWRQSWHNHIISLSDGAPLPSQYEQNDFSL